MSCRRALLPFLALLTAAQLPAAPSNATVGEVTTYALLPTASAPGSIAFDSGGNLYVAGLLTGVGKVWKIAPGGTPVTEFATGIPDPKGVAVDANDFVYVSDWNDNTNQVDRIWKITPAGVKSVWVSSITQPMYLLFDPAGNLFVAEWGAFRVQSVTPAGVISNYRTGVGGSGEEVGGLAYDQATGDLYVGTGPNIKKIGPGGATIATVATGFVGIYGLVRDGAGFLYASRYSHRDMLTSTPGGVVSTYAGAHLANACIDGPLLTARFSLPAGMVLRNNTIYISDSGCHMVRTIDLPGGTPTTRTTWGRLKTLYR